MKSIINRVSLFVESAMKRVELIQMKLIKNNTRGNIILSNINDSIMLQSFS